jgi:hemerythrin
MHYILWTSLYETNVQEIDNQHKKLVALINTLFDSIAVKDRQAILNQTFTELVNYTIYHFKFEEDLMLKSGYKGYQNHKKEHSIFVEKINRYMDKLEITDNKVLLNVINFLKNWLLNHILVVDKETVLSIQGNPNS